MTEHLFITLIGLLVGALLALNTKMLAGMSKRLDAMERKLERARTAADCDRIKSDCQAVRREKSAELKEGEGLLWDALNKHSHTGLPEGSKVIR